MNAHCPCRIFHVKSDEAWLPIGVYRVVSWTEKRELIVLYQMPSNSKAMLSTNSPTISSKAPLLTGLEKGTIVAINEAQLVENHCDVKFKVGPRETERRTRRLEILVEFEKLDLVNLLLRKAWSKETKAIAEKVGIGYKTVQRVICKFIASGGDTELAVKYNYGQRNKGRNLSKKQGRPRNVIRAGHSQKQGINKKDHEEFVRTYLDLKGELRPRTIQAQIDDLYANYFFERYEDQGNGLPLKGIPFDPECRLTYAQYRDLLTDLRGEFSEQTRWLPKSRLDQMLIPLSGSADGMIPFPGHTYILDATVADVYLVSSFNRARIIGRPVVYCVIDAMTRLILAMYVTLFSPSFVQARNAIYLALSDKELLLRHLDMSDRRDYFRRGMRPQIIFIDRAELFSREGRRLAGIIEVSNSYAGAYMASWKGIVERSFGVLNDELIHWLPGAVVKGRERGMPDHRLDAVLTVKEFWRVLMNQVCRWNAAKSLSAKTLPSMMRDRKRTCPLDFWDWGETNLHGSPYYFDRDKLMRDILPNQAARISRDGIQFDGGKYFAPWILENENFIRARAGYASEVKLVIPPEYPDRAFCNLGDDIYREMQLSHNYATNDASQIDVLDYEKYKKLSGTMDEYSFQPIRDDLTSDTHETINRARELTAASIKAQAMSNAERLKGVAKAREDEIATSLNGGAKIETRIDATASSVGPASSMVTNSRDARKNDIASLIRKRLANGRDS